jgi:hypothetical protein
VTTPACVEVMYSLEIVRVVDRVQIEVCADDWYVTLRSEGQEPRREIPSWWRKTLWRWRRQANQRYYYSNSCELK